MNKKIVDEVTNRSGGICEICNMREGTEFHHCVYGSGKRKQCETKDSVINSCYYCHRSSDGVHGKNGRELDIRLKRELQQVYFDKGYSEKKVRRLMGGKIH